MVVVKKKKFSFSFSFVGVVGREGRKVGKKCLVGMGVAGENREEDDITHDGEEIGCHAVWR